MQPEKPTLGQPFLISITNPDIEEKEVKFGTQTLSSQKEMFKLKRHREVMTTDSRTHIFIFTLSSGRFKIKNASKNSNRFVNYECLHEGEQHFEYTDYMSEYTTLILHG